jgi:hypothetical protein
MKTSPLRWMLGLGAAALALGLLVFAALGLLLPGAAPGDAPGAAGHKMAEEFGPPPPVPAGLEEWALIQTLPLPADFPARAIAVGPQGLLAAGGRGLLRYSLDAGGARLAARIPLDLDTLALAAAPDGRLALSDGRQVLVLAADGGRLGHWRSPGAGSLILGLAFMGERLWLTDGQAKSVRAYSFAGEELGVLVPGDGLDFIVPGPHFPLAVLPGAGTLAVANPGRHGVMIFSPSGERRASWLRPGQDWTEFPGCCNPVAIAWLADSPAGASLVCADKGLPRVKIFDPAGRLRAIPEAGGEFAPGTEDIALACDSLNRIYVLDIPKQEIRVHRKKEG